MGGPGRGGVGSRRVLSAPSLIYSACPQKAARDTVLQEWLHLACHRDAHPELVRRHLVTFRAMSASLLDLVVNLPDGHGNTALHHCVSLGNFPVARQLLASGEPAQRGRHCLVIRGGEAQS